MLVVASFVRLRTAKRAEATARVRDGAGQPQYRRTFIANAKAQRQHQFRMRFSLAGILLEEAWARHDTNEVRTEQVQPLPRVQ